MIEDFSWIKPPIEKGNRSGRNSKQKQQLKLKLAHKHGWRCKLCGKSVSMKTSTLDHILRVRDGGSWNVSNLRLSCRDCNEERA
jgi:5-methylcytosine-specific restriction endonuclease McrA